MKCGGIVFLLGVWGAQPFTCSRPQKRRSRQPRCSVSTIFGEGVDSLLLFPLALYGVVPDVELPKMMLLQVVLKTGYEIVVLPITNIVVRWVKKYEGEDVYDNGISYNILKIWRNN